MNKTQIFADYSAFLGRTDSAVNGVSATAAYAAYAYAGAASSKHYQKMADKLIQLMKAAKKP